MLKQIYQYAYFPLVGMVWILGFFGRLPRVLPSTKGEGHERRYFYGSVWAVSVAQPVLGLMWLWLPKNPQTNIIKLVVFWGFWYLWGRSHTSDGCLEPRRLYLASLLFPTSG